MSGLRTWGLIASFFTLISTSLSFAQTENGSVAESTQAASATVPTVTSPPTPSPTPSATATPSPTPPPGMSDGEYRERTYNLDRWKVVLAGLALLGAAVTLYFTYKRLVVMEQRAKEEELSSYRERLFSEDPSARIAAAMSLAKYPEEAIWLVNRWAQEHKLIKEGSQRILYVDPRKFDLDISLDIRMLSLIEKKSNFERVKRAIEDALGMMAEEASWDWDYWRKRLFGDVWRNFKKLKWFLPLNEMRVLRRSVMDCLRGLRKVKGPRLDRKRITIDIGPIPLWGAYMRRSYLVGVNLEGANLSDAHLERAKFSSAHLERAVFSSTHLEKAEFTDARLEGANLKLACLEGADLTLARLEGANLLGANLEGAHLSWANLESANLEGIEGWEKIADIKNANIRGVENAPEGFVEWAKEKGAVDISTEEREAWKDQHPPQFLL